MDGSSERQKKRKVDIDSEVLETSDISGSTRRVPLKECRLVTSESKEGGRAKQPLTLNIKKAQEYSAAITRQETARLNTDTVSQIAEETRAPLPPEVERQLRQEEELRQKQRANTLTLEEEESEEMEARLTQLVSQNSLQTAQEKADLKNQLVNLQLQQAQQINTIASQTLQNANRLDGGGAAISIFGSGRSIP